MKALVFKHPKKVSVEDYPDPKIKKPTEAIIKVTSTAICGSDLHIYNGFFPQLRKMVLGHEFMGIVEEVGSEVKSLKRGDRVVVPFPIAASAVRRGGVISMVGVYGTPYSHFPSGQLFDKEISLKMGQAMLHKYIDELVTLVDQKKVVLDDIITHVLPLDQAPHAYDIFCKKQDNCLKVVLKP